MLVIKSGESAITYTPFILPDAGDLALELPKDDLLDAASAYADAMLNKMESRHAAEADARQMDVMALDEEAGSIAESARAEAEQIIALAHARAGEVERAAREKAIQEARALVAAETAAAVEPLRMQLAQSLEEITALREQMATIAEYELVQLAVEIAKKIVRREVTVDREIVISLARVALARLHTRALATVHLHPDDYQYVCAHREKLGAAGTVNLVGDSSISRGGCLVETDLGQVDARIEQQFGEIERGFLHELEA